MSRSSDEAELLKLLERAADAEELPELDDQEILPALRMGLARRAQQYGDACGAEWRAEEARRQSSLFYVEKIALARRHNVATQERERVGRLYGETKSRFNSALSTSRGGAL